MGASGQEVAQLRVCLFDAPSQALLELAPGHSSEFKDMHDLRPFPTITKGREILAIK